MDNPQFQLLNRQYDHIDHMDRCVFLRQKLWVVKCFQLRCRYLCCQVKSEEKFKEKEEIFLVYYEKPKIMQQIAIKRKPKSIPLLLKTRSLLQAELKLM